MAYRALAFIFDALFINGSPWPYETCSYEAAKRSALLCEISTGAQIIVEVGSADGHNLLAIASHSAESKIIGIDVAQKACRIAREKTKNYPHIYVENADLTNLLLQHPYLRGAVDCIIMSEVLYYLGGNKSMTSQLKSLRDLLSQDGQLILLHGSDDADRLHLRVAQILGLQQIREHRKSALGREFLVTTLGNPGVCSNSIVRATA